LIEAYYKIISFSLNKKKEEIKSIEKEIDFYSNILKKLSFTKRKDKLKRIINENIK